MRFYSTLGHKEGWVSVYPAWIIVLLALMVLLLVTWPFFSKSEVPDSATNSVPAVLSDRDQAYVELADLEYDYHMGKVLPEAYANIRQDLLSQLIEVRDAEKKAKDAIAANLELEIRKRTEGELNASETKS